MKMIFDMNNNLLDSGMLLKISKLEYLEDLRRGKIYMNKLETFRKIEQEGQGDNEEGLIGHFPEGTMSIGDTVIADVKNISFYAFNKNPIFCITAVPLIKTASNEYSYKVDRQIFRDFIFNPTSKYGAMIIDKHAFAEAFQTELSKKNIECCWDEVTYSDKRPKLKKDELYRVAYHKRLRFSHQHEWRLMLFTEVEDHYELNIGDISNHSEIIPIDFNSPDMEFKVVLDNVANQD